MLQGIVATLIVVGCAGYAAWTLLPAAARRGIAVVLLKRPLPGAAARFLRRHAETAGGCACNGCDRHVASPPPAGGPAATAAPLVFHPRRKG